MKPVYRCELDHLQHEDYDGSYRARVKLYDDHKALGGRAGDMCTTSKVLSVDFERGVLVTKNSIYLFKGVV